MAVVTQRGAGKRLKRVLPPGLFRHLTRLYNGAMTAVPFGVKYGIGLRLRRHKIPYRLVGDGDRVIQVGAPRDILEAGRSRAVYLSMCAGRGTVLVVEPDPDNCEALRRATGAAGIANIDLAEEGAWETKTQLSFLSDPDHPAANILEDVSRPTDGSGPAVQRLVVDVDTLDNIADARGFDRPRLVSITTNGAELQIVGGMKAMLADGYPEYISLAQTRPGYVEAMAALGYDHIAHDDRGFCFRRTRTASGDNPA